MKTVRMRLPNPRTFLHAHAMAAVAVLAALASCVFVPPDAAYLTYVDWETLGRLAAMLAVVGALGRAGAFQFAAAALAARCRRARGLVGVLVGATALASMFVTNDMALVGLLPLAGAALVACGRRDLLPVTFVLQGVAANLCGMLLPFGNPQNIYLSAKYSIGFGQFVATMAAPFAVSVALVATGCFVFSDRASVQVETRPPAPSAGRAAVLVLLLALCVAAVLGAGPVGGALLVVLGALLVVDRRGLAHTDWGLIGTFAAFFVFSGNVARIAPLADALEAWLGGGAFLPAALLSQLISNVPAAVVLSRFTADWAGLLAGVNVGGVGTPIASLATLIVVSHFQSMAPGLRLSRRRFWGLLLGLNFACLAALLAVGCIAGW